MAKFSLISQALVATSTFANPVPTTHASAVSVATMTATSTTASTMQGYVPVSPIVYKNYLSDMQAIVRQTFSNYQEFSLDLMEKTVAAVATNQPDISRLLEKAPFTNIQTLYQNTVTSVIAGYKTKIDATKDVDELKQNLTDFVNEVNTNFAALPPSNGDIYQTSISSTDLEMFVTKLKTAQIPLIVPDASALINKSAGKLLDDINSGITSHEVNEFQAAIAQKYATSDDFIKAIIGEIYDGFVQKTEINNSVKSDVNKTYDTWDKHIKDFGLAKMTSDFESIKSEIDTDNANGIQPFVDKLHDSLAKMNSVNDAINAIDSFITDRQAYVTAENLKITNRAHDLIDAVQADWTKVLSDLPANPSYWLALQAEGAVKATKPDYFAALKILLGANSANLNNFILKYVDATNASKEPENFNTQLAVSYDDALPNGQRTRINGSFVLSTKVAQAHAAGAQGYITDYANNKDTYERAIHSYVSVSVDDLKNIILSDFAKNSNPSSQTTDPWAINSQVSNLDLYTYFDGKTYDDTGNVNGTVDQTNFDPDIYSFDNTKNLLMLFPRLDWIIHGEHSDPQNIVPSSYSRTFEDTLFANGANEPIISIAKRPEVSNINKPQSENKFTNYDLHLLIKSGSDTATFDDDSEIIQANNVSVFDGEMDEAFADAFNNYLKAAPNDENSYVGIVVGGIWDWQGITDSTQKKAGTYHFDHFYELLNLLFSNDPKETLIPKVVFKDDEKVLGLSQNPTDIKAYNDILQAKEIAQLNAISQILYSNSTNVSPLKPLFTLYSAEELATKLSVGGDITLSRTSDGLGWETNVTFTTRSSRVLDNKTTVPSFRVSVHSLREAIEEAIQKVSGIYGEFQPLVNQLISKNDITAAQIQSLTDQIASTVKDFKNVANEDNINTIEQLNGITDTHINTIKNQMATWFGINSKNASSQISGPLAQQSTADLQLKNSDAYKNLTPSNLKDVARYENILKKQSVSAITNVPLTTPEEQELAALTQKMAEYGISDDLQAYVTPTNTLARIQTTIEGAAKLAADLFKNDSLEQEIKDLGTDQIAEFLSKGNLSDPAQWASLLDFVKNPLAMQQVKLTKPMKAVIIGLGSFMGLVGIGTTFSTLRSFKTNKNISSIGDGASIAYEKPKKTMAIKAAISISALVAAATIISLVFTLGGGL